MTVTEPHPPAPATYRTPAAVRLALYAVFALTGVVLVLLSAISLLSVRSRSGTLVPVNALATITEGVGPLTVPGDDAVGPVDEAEDIERQAAAGRAVGDVKIGPAALAEALDQPGLGQELQVPADARLALPEDHRQILDAQLTRGEQQQDAQARRLCRCLERGNNVAAGE